MAVIRKFILGKVESMKIKAGKSLGGILFCLYLFCFCSAALPTELHLLAGAGLRGPTDEVISRFEEKTGISVVVEYGGSGKLLARYHASGQGDLFMPGDYFDINRLKQENKTVADKPFLFHTPVIAMNKAKNIKISSIQDLAKPGLRLALGDPKAMAMGRTADEILKKSGFEKEILKNLTVYGATVKQLAMYVAQGSVDVAIIARADAFQMREKIIHVDIDTHLYTPSTIGVAVLSTAQNIKDSILFLNYITQPESIKQFTDAGFLPLE